MDSFSSKAAYLRPNIASTAYPSQLSSDSAGDNVVFSKHSSQIAENYKVGASRRELSGSEDDTPIKSKLIMKSKLLSDSDEEDAVPMKPLESTSQTHMHQRDPHMSRSVPIGIIKLSSPASTVESRTTAQHNLLLASASRKDASSESSSDSSSSNETSSSDRSDSLDTSSVSRSSESSDGSSSESYDSEEEHIASKKPVKKDKRQGLRPTQSPPPKKAPQTTAAKARADARSISKSREGSDNEEAGIRMGSFDPRNRSEKAKLVAKLLCRWWYVLPDWPPADFDYVAKLSERRLKLVSLENYEDMDDVDEHGFTKVYQISAFPGVFRDPNGKAIDLRPAEGRPCYNNLIKKSEHELLQLVETAIKNQMEQLKDSAYDERKTHKRLQLELLEVSKELNRYRVREDICRRKATVNKP